MGETKASGLATAVALAGGVGDLGLSGGEQQVLFADADDAPGSLTPAKSGPRGGRPKGARNRSTEEWRQYLLSRYQSPLIGLAETWGRAAEELARELFLTRTVYDLAPGQEAIGTNRDQNGGVISYLVWDLERAFEIQQAARVAALPYLHQKQPLAVEAKGESRGLLMIGALTSDQAAAVGFGLPLPEIEENQRVIEGEIEKSDGKKSDGSLMD